MEFCEQIRRAHNQLSLSLVSLNLVWDRVHSFLLRTIEGFYPVSQTGQLIQQERGEVTHAASQRQNLPASTGTGLQRHVLVATPCLGTGLEQKSASSFKANPTLSLQQEPCYMGSTPGPSDSLETLVMCFIHNSLHRA